MFYIRTENFEIYIFSDAFISIDGGAMFGVLPKVIWNNFYKTDKLNRIRIATNSMLIITKRNLKILIDTGMGEKFSKKFEKIYNIKNQGSLIKNLKKLNIYPDDIHIVINTHLHFDHCGYNTTFEENKIVPSFKKAKYIIQRREFEYALKPDEKSKPSYLEENFYPLKKTKQLELIDGSEEIEKGIRLILNSSHSVGHQSILIKSSDKKIFFTGDIIPLALNLKPNYITAFDLFPLELISTKKQILKKAQEENWTLIFPHEIKYPFGNLIQIKNTLFKDKRLI